MLLCCNVGSLCSACRAAETLSSWDIGTVTGLSIRFALVPGLSFRPCFCGLELRVLLKLLESRPESVLTSPITPVFFLSPTSSASSSGGTSIFPVYQNTHQMRLRKITIDPAQIRKSQKKTLTNTPIRSTARPKTSKATASQKQQVQRPSPARLRAMVEGKKWQKQVDPGYDRISIKVHIFETHLPAKRPGALYLLSVEWLNDPIMK